MKPSPSSISPLRAIDKGCLGGEQTLETHVTSSSCTQGLNGNSQNGMFSPPSNSPFSHHRQVRCFVFSLYIYIYIYSLTPRFLRPYDSYLVKLRYATDTLLYCRHHVISFFPAVYSTPLYSTPLHAQGYLLYGQLASQLQLQLSPVQAHIPVLFNTFSSSPASSYA